MGRIISAILGWDASDFRRTADKIERAKDAPPTAVLAAIQSYVSQPRSAQEQLRALSAERGISIVTAILESSPDTSISNISLNESHHTKCLDYLSALLSARDRDEITSVLCRTSPDLFTQAVREGFAAFDPLIRSVHVAIDLKVYVETTRAFVDDFLSVVKRGSTSNGSGNGIGTGNTNLNGTGNAGSGVVGNMIGNVITIANGKGIRNDKVKEAIAVPPSVADFAALLRRHKHVTYRWCHELCSRCPEIREQYVAYAKSLASEFRHSRPNNSTSTVATPSVAGAGAMGESLIELFSSLPSDKQVAVSSALGEHARYLASLRGWSRARMQAVLDEQKNVNRNGTGDSDKQQQLLTAAPGPGIYLAKWQALLCETAVTPAGGGGGLRFGRDIVGRSTKSYGGKTGPASPAAGEAQEAVSSVPDTAPQIEVVVDALAGQWRDLLLRAEGAGIGRTGRQWQTDDGHRNRS